MSAREALPTGVALAAKVTPTVCKRAAVVAAAGLAYLGVRRLRGVRGLRGA